MYASHEVASCPPTPRKASVWPSLRNQGGLKYTDSFIIKIKYNSTDPRFLPLPYFFPLVLPLWCAVYHHFYAITPPPTHTFGAV